MTTPDALLERLRHQDRAAFAALHAQVGDALFAFGMTLVRDPDRAADLVQDTYLIALRSIDSFRGQSALRTWLCGIMVNRAREQRRRVSREVPSSTLPQELETRFGTDGRWNEPPVPWEDPGHLLDRGALARAAREEMRALGETARTVMEMCDVEGFAPVEIAEILGLTNGNVRVILHRARAQVREQLERRFGAERCAATGDADRARGGGETGIGSAARFDAPHRAGRGAPWLDATPTGSAVSAHAVWAGHGRPTDRAPSLWGQALRSMGRLVGKLIPPGRVDRWATTPARWATC